MVDGSSDPANRQQLHLLVLRCQCGDERAFELLYNHFAPQTLRYLYGVVGDRAEDIQQDVWLSVYRRIAQLNEPHAFAAWLFRLTRFRLVDGLRQERRHRTLLEDASDYVSSPLENDFEEDEQPYDLLTLGNALAALPPAQREVLVLRYQESMSYSQIALLIGCSIGTVRSRLHYAKRRVAELLESR